MQQRFCILCGKPITGLSYCRDCYKKGKNQDECHRAASRRRVKEWYKKTHQKVNP